MELHQTDKSAQSTLAYKFLAPVNKGLVHGGCSSDLEKQLFWLSEIACRVSLATLTPGAHCLTYSTEASIAS
jgi:hypothetical protein